MDASAVVARHAKRGMYDDGRIAVRVLKKVREDGKIGQINK